MKTSNFHDKSEWGPGAWQAEPDRAQWISHGLDCLLLRNHIGAWCGYVGVPEGHPAHGGDDDTLPGIEVHGGLTFAGPCQDEKIDPECHPEQIICHSGEGIANENVWWLGFDTAHGFDFPPALYVGLPSRLRPQTRPPHQSYRDFDYAKAETEKLAGQLAAMAR